HSRLWRQLDCFIQELSAEDATMARRPHLPSLARNGKSKEPPHASGRPLRVAPYSPDTMGIGHMPRNALMAHAIAASGMGASILLITGAREACTFSLPNGADCLSLPSYGKEASGKYQARSLSVSLEELVSLRSHMILAGLEAFKPDVLV